MAETAARILTDIADAIREKDGTTVPIAVQNYAARVLALPTPPPTGFSNNRRTYRFHDFLPPDVAEAAGLVRLNGRALHQGADPQDIFDTFKTDWINQISEMNYPQGLYNAPASELAMGRYLYAGTHGNSSASFTSILKIDTLTGESKEITGLPGRVHNVLQPVGRKLYLLHAPTSGNVTIQDVVCVDVLDDTVQLIRATSTWLALSGMYLVPNTPNPSTGEFLTPDVAWRLFYGVTNNATTYLPYLELDADGVALRARTVHTHTSSTTHQNLFIWKHKLVDAITNTRITVVDTSIIPPGWSFGVGYDPHSQMITVSATGTGWGVAGDYLYNGATGQINRIDMERLPVWNAARSFWEGDLVIRQTGGLPSRLYNVFEYDGPRNKIFVGSTASATSILRLRHSDGQSYEIGDLPNRAHIGFRRVGDKIYVASTTSFNNLVVIDMANDAADTIAMPASRTYNGFLLNGTTLYALQGTTASAIAIINTNNDTASDVTGLPNRIHDVMLAVDGRLYVGSTNGTTPQPTLPVINLATNTFLELLQAPIARIFSTLRFYNGVIYVFGGFAAGLVGHIASVAIIAQSMLPNTPLPVYMRVGH